MKIIKKNGMTRQQRLETAHKMADDFLEKCDGMYGDEMVDILHWHFLFCMASFSDWSELDLRECLEQSKQFIQDAIDDLKESDKRLN